MHRPQHRTSGGPYLPASLAQWPCCRPSRHPAAVKGSGPDVPAGTRERGSREWAAGAMRRLARATLGPREQPRRAATNRAVPPARRAPRFRAGSTEPTIRQRRHAAVGETAMTINLRVRNFALAALLAAGVA